MDSWEWNKIAGAALGVLLFILVIRQIAVLIYDVPPPAKPGYVVEVSEEAEPQVAAIPPAAEPPPDFAVALPAADVNHGKEVATRCQQCHDVAKGGPNRIGPTLWGVIDRPRASVPGYSYSGAMNADHAPWTYDTLFAFLKAPSAVVRGSKMSFAGIRSTEDRIDLIAYLRTLSDTPAPLSGRKP
jgi:cytochrome c